MKGIKKRHLILGSILGCGLAFVFPFVIRTCGDNLFSVLSLSFAAVGTVATIFTLIIAIFLYDRFGLEGKFIEKQTDKVLELADLLKGKTITVQSNDSIFFIRPSRTQLADFKGYDFYQRDYNKTILMSPDNYELGLGNIISIRRSYWLPKEIKEKMSFLQFFGFDKVDNPLDEKYVRFEFHGSKVENWMVPLPEMKFDAFNNNLSDLVKEIDNWIGKHSGIGLDLKLEEPNQ